MNKSAENVTMTPTLLHGNFTLTWFEIAILWPEVICILSFAFACNILVGLPTNVWVLWLIMRELEDVLASEVFTLNLVVLDLIFCLYPLIAALDYFVLSSVLSETLNFFFAIILFGHPLFQCCICLERYLAVLHPLIYLRYRPLRYRAGCSAVVWMMMLGGSSVIHYVRNSALMCVLVVLLILLLLVKSYCCLAILWALKCPGPGERQEPHLAKKKAFRIIMVSLVFTLVNYLPVIVVILLRSFISCRTFITMSAVSFSLSVFCTFVQPLFFLSRVGKLQCIMGH